MKFLKIFLGMASKALLFIIILSINLTGCNIFITQPQGLGIQTTHRLKATQSRYYLYLPKDYHLVDKCGLIVTIHGMKPFDDAFSQCREWQEQADKHNLVICAPILKSPDLFSPLPLNKITDTLKQDEQNIISILKYLSQSSWFDPQKVAITSWSYGGYISHYIFNKYHYLFSHLIARQSNFSEKLLNEDEVQFYKNKGIAIFYGEHDFPLCIKESERAIEWYSSHGVEPFVVKQSGKYHQRTPEVAADFFVKN